jgi:ParB/RepB/Spo0J family partition protein
VIPIEDVVEPPDRVRVEFGNIDELSNSILELGLIEPIVLTPPATLVAGSRRLRALKRLGVKELRLGEHFVWRDGLSPLQAKAMELEENIRRKQLTWQEEVEGKRQLLALMEKLHEAEGGFSLRRLAAMIGESPGTVSEDLRLADAMQVIPVLRQATTKESAKRQLTLHLLAAAAAAAAPSAADGEDRHRVLCGDFRAVAPSAIADGSADFVCTDMPYGAHIETGIRHRVLSQPIGFVDTIDDDTIAALASESWRVLRTGGFAVFFFGFASYASLTTALRAVGFDVDPVPAIWVKNTQYTTDFYTRLCRAYEPILIARKGDARLRRPGARNVYTFDAPPGKTKTHVAEKPVELLMQLIRDFSDASPETLCVDFMAGSGSLGVAAKRLGCRSVCIDISETACGIARSRLQATEGKE